MRSTPGPVVDRGAGSGRLVRVVHRPGSVQTEIRIGHLGLPRRIPDFHAVSVMSAILGGLFNSRLNMQLREAKGYTYGAGAGFDLRRGAGPFTARAAVNTEVTVPAVIDTLAELERMRDGPVEASELAAARDFLVGVFPLRFETPGAVVGALAGLAVHGLPLDELTDYRARIEAVDVDAIAAAARTHLAVDRAAIVLVGDVDAFGAGPGGGRARPTGHRPRRAGGGAARRRGRGRRRGRPDRRGRGDRPDGRRRGPGPARHGRSGRSRRDRSDSDSGRRRAPDSHVPSRLRTLEASAAFLVSRRHGSETFRREPDSGRGLAEVRRGSGLRRRLDQLGPDL